MSTQPADRRALNAADIALLFCRRECALSAHRRKGKCSAARAVESDGTAAGHAQSTVVGGRHDVSADVFPGFVKRVRRGRLALGFGMKR
ncbi:hypothetical protein Pa4123_75620 [Phytohabitans aurantiacus]|uniref:DUF397 domain-containing protein n=1 Tax=Phytohabitans aurantiacus TaxID=3016789 RepID=A0ABQ5R678_9ACTN|nr:hypothetical protein Pa4123_75620 [Phytohabitans aurantiacus]